MRFLRVLLSSVVGILAMPAIAETALDYSPLSSQSQCCESLSEYRFSEFEGDKPVRLAVSLDSAHMGFNGELVGFAGVRLLSSEQRRVEVRSYAMKHGVFVPNLIFLDDQFQVVSAHTRAANWESMVENTGRSAIRKTVPVPERARFLVAYGSKAHEDLPFRMSSQGVYWQGTSQRCGEDIMRGQIECWNSSTRDGVKMFRFTTYGSKYGVVRFSLL